VTFFAKTLAVIETVVASKVVRQYVVILSAGDDLVEDSARSIRWLSRMLLVLFSWQIQNGSFFVRLINRTEDATIL
jgi:hypothetical protein